MVLSLVILFIQLCITIFMFYMVLAFLTGAPFVPTKDKAAEAMIRLAHIKKGMRVYDLGSGNGKLLRLAQKKGAKAVGYEINPFLVVLSKLTTTTRWKNLWSANVKDADIVFIYLLPWKMDKLAAKLKRECKKGTLIVSNSFIFPGWKVKRADEVNHVYAFVV